VRSNPVVGETISREFQANEANEANEANQEEEEDKEKTEFEREEVRNQWKGIIEHESHYWELDLASCPEYNCSEFPSCCSGDTRAALLRTSPWNYGIVIK